MGRRGSVVLCGQAGTTNNHNIDLRRPSHINHLRDHLGFNDYHLSRLVTTTMYTATTPLSPPLSPSTLSTSKRAASEISEGAPDDPGQQAADRTAAANARSTKAQMKVNGYMKMLWEQYNDRDDIAITEAEMPEIRVTGGETSRLKSVCGVDIRKLPLKVLRVIFTKESLPKFSDHSKKEICDILVDLKINGKNIVDLKIKGKNNAYSRKSAGGKASYNRKILGGDATAVGDKGTPNQEHQDAAAGGDSSSPQSLQAASPKGLQAANPAGELMALLQAKIERLRKSQKVAHDVGLVDDVKEYNSTIKEVEKEIDDLEDAKIDQLRRETAAAAADNQ
jgi:uncharacterized protein YdcH (DUF465 family)